MHEARCILTPHGSDCAGLARDLLNLFLPKVALRFRVRRQRAPSVLDCCQLLTLKDWRSDLEDRDDVIGAPVSWGTV